MNKIYCMYPAIQPYLDTYYNFINLTNKYNSNITNNILLHSFTLSGELLQMLLQSSTTKCSCCVFQRLTVCVFLHNLCWFLQASLIQLSLGQKNSRIKRHDFSNLINYLTNLWSIFIALIQYVYFYFFLFYFKTFFLQFDIKESLHIG